MNILYMRCACKTDDRLLKAKYTKLGYEVRTTRYNPSFRAEAEAYNLKLPFIVQDGKATEL